MAEPSLFELDEPSTKANQLRRARKRHVEVLGVSCCVALLAFALQVLPDQQHVALRGLARYPLPHVCASRTWLGMKCPGCGLTRSIIHFAHGDWRASLRTHRLGAALATFIACQIPYRVLALRRRDRPLLCRRACQWIAAVAIGVLIGSWLFDLAFRPESLMTGEPNWLRPR